MLLPSTFVFLRNQRPSLFYLPNRALVSWFLYTEVLPAARDSASIFCFWRFLCVDSSPSLRPSTLLINYTFTNPKIIAKKTQEWANTIQGHLCFPTILIDLFVLTSKGSKSPSKSTPLRRALKAPSQKLLSAPTDISSTWNHCVEPIRANFALRILLTETPPPQNQAHRTLHLTDEISCNNNGPNVLQCVIDNEPNHLIAKIFDPLYFPYPDNVTATCDWDYICETAAYKTIQHNGIDGLYTPKYHGSWSFNIPFQQAPSGLRSARLILMEYLPGVSISSLLDRNLQFHVPPKDRLEILADALEIDMRLRFIGVEHGDIAARNVILVNLDIFHYQRPRVMVIDFNIAKILPEPLCMKITRPTNPLYSYWRSSPVYFDGWVPRPFSENKKAWKGWVKQRWYKSDRFADYKEAGIRWNGREETEEIEMVFPEPDPEISCSENDSWVPGQAGLGRNQQI